MHSPIYDDEYIKIPIKEFDLKSISEFIEIAKGYTRINVKISSLEKKSLIQKGETALNGNGPEITQENIEELLKKNKKNKFK